MNQKRMVMVMGCLALILLFCAASLAAEEEPKVGQTLGNVKFPKPMSDEDAKYLGIEKPAEFTRQGIKAPYVMVEQMNTS
jgi:hypothetical protein